MEKLNMQTTDVVMETQGVRFSFIWRLKQNLTPCVRGVSTITFGCSQMEMKRLFRSLFPQ